MKRLIVLATLLMGIGTGVGSTLVVTTGHAAQATGTCKTGARSESHNVMIMNGKTEPTTTIAKLCDSLTISNMDNLAREIAFGPHENHVPYDGVAEKVLNLGQSLTITLNQAGSFHFHDHLHDAVQGYFTVTSQN